MIKCSIIIPHKNSLGLLKRCLSSIPVSKDIEIIVVDDNSDSKLVDFHALQELESDRVHILYNKDSKGAGHARNLGLSIATGKWLLFSDADDFFVKGAFDIISSHFEDKADIIYFLSERRYSESLELFDSSCLGLNDKVKAFVLSPENEDKLKYGICVPWGRLISHKLIKENNIQFDETRFANDTMFAIKAAYASKVITADPRVVYCFTANKGSLTHTLNKDSIRCRYGVDVRKNSFLKSIGKDELQSSITHHIYHSLKYGLNFTVELLVVAVKAKVNPFYGCIGWIANHNKDKSKRDKITNWSK